MAWLNIRLFGAFAVDLDGQAVTRFESQKVRALLAYLAVESGQHDSLPAAYRWLTERAAPGQAGAPREQG
jgi:DNA-binding SARP family transcriptional activator